MVQQGHQASILPGGNDSVHCLAHALLTYAIPSPVSQGESVLPMWIQKVCRPLLMSPQLATLRDWWDLLIRVGPGYGYYPNAPKTSLIVKEEMFSLAEAVFKGSGIAVTIRKANNTLGQ